MALMSSYEQNVLLSAEFNGVAPTLPADFYVALYIASLGEYVSGLTTTLGATIVPSTPNNRIYKVTTVGTTALTPSTEPTWPTTDGGTVTDANGNVWTEQTPSIKAGTINEASGGGYARQAVANTTTNWTLTTNAVGNKNVANATTINFGAVTANLGYVAAVVLFDALTAGNLRYIAEQMTPQNVVKGNTPQFAPGVLNFIGN